MLNGSRSSGNASVLPYGGDVPPLRSLPKREQVSRVFYRSNLLKRDEGSLNRYERFTVDLSLSLHFAKCILKLPFVLCQCRIRGCGGNFSGVSRSNHFDPLKEGESSIDGYHNHRYFLHSKSFIMGTLGIVLILSVLSYLYAVGQESNNCIWDFVCLCSFGLIACSSALLFKIAVKGF